MSEAHRSDTAHAHAAASGAERNAKIEQLLLVGLDHYFAAQYEQAINVWTRALFLDRSHPRARAYIERARSALAERQRESEELLQTGVDAFRRGEAEQARRLLQAAIDGGAPAEEALAVLERLNRLEATATLAAAPRTAKPRPPQAADESQPSRRPIRAIVAAAVAALSVAIGGYVAASGSVAWRSLLALDPEPAGSIAPPVPRTVSLPLPRRGEMALQRARALASAGRLREALTALNEVRATDAQRADADRLRADVQRRLLALPEAAGGGRGERRVP